jgi:hypothetical protein
LNADTTIMNADTTQTPGGRADGKLAAGEVVVALNGKNARAMTHSDIIIIVGTGCKVELTVIDQAALADADADSGGGEGGGGDVICAERSTSGTSRRGTARSAGSASVAAQAIQSNSTSSACGENATLEFDNSGAGGDGSSIDASATAACSKSPLVVIPEPLEWMLSETTVNAPLDVVFGTLFGPESEAFWQSFYSESKHTNINIGRWAGGIREVTCVFILFFW